MGQKYVSSLYRISVSDWQQYYSQYLQNELGLAESMALIHPDHYKHVSTANQIRGDRTFPKEQGMTSIKCSADVIWGYSCSIELTSGIYADHLFPYSLGGPTVSNNKLYLCEFHNQVKGNDIHIYPWEEGEPEWLKGLLFRINRLLTLIKQRE